MKLFDYYEMNKLKPNMAETQTCVFHFRNGEAKRKLRIKWHNSELKYTDDPKYLGVVLDRSLTFKQHCNATKMKVMARTNLIRTLICSK